MPNRPAVLRWTPAGRAVVFALAATSIASLLVEFYRLAFMRTFTLGVLVPSTVALVVLAVVGDRRLRQSVVTGAVGGTVAAVAYDLFRLPFVVAAADHVGPAWARLPLFKVFPRFGAMILAVPFRSDWTDSAFPLSAHLVGWLYHVSNGATFGVMYVALIGDATRRTWWWAVVGATGLEVALLVTPYTSFFGIAQTPRFVVVTLLAHLVFGVVLGRWVRAKRVTG